MRCDLKVDGDVKRRIIGGLKACRPTVDGCVAGVEGVRSERAGLRSRVQDAKINAGEDREPAKA